MSHTELGGELVRRRRPAEPRGELLARRGEPHARLVQPPRQPDGRRPVAQVALHLPGDGGDRERHELLTALRVEPLDRVQQPDGAGLDQVVVLGPAAVVAVGEGLDQGHVQLDETSPRALIPILAVGGQQSAGGRISSRAETSGHDVLLGGGEHRGAQTTLTANVAVSETWARARGGVSDLHLGIHTRADLLRRPEAQGRLFEAIAGADEVVLLGDAIELRDGSLAESLERALPFFEALGAALGGRRLTIVPGNHDHRLAEDALRRAGRLGLEQRFEVRPGDALDPCCARWGSPVDSPIRACGCATTCTRCTATISTAIPRRGRSNAARERRWSASAGCPDGYARPPATRRPWRRSTG